MALKVVHQELLNYLLVAEADFKDRFPPLKRNQFCPAKRSTTLLQWIETYIVETECQSVLAQEELCSKICMAVEKFSPNRRWQIDTLIKVMCLGKT